MNRSELAALTTAEIVQTYYDITRTIGLLRVNRSLGIRRYRGQPIDWRITDLEQDATCVIDEAQRRGVLDSLIH